MRFKRFSSEKMVIIFQFSWSTWSIWPSSVPPNPLRTCQWRYFRYYKTYFFFFVLTVSFLEIFEMVQKKLCVGNTDVHWHCRYHLTRHHYPFLSQMENQFHGKTWKNKVGRALWRTPCPHSYKHIHTHTSCLFKAGCSGPCQWLSLRMETSQPLYAFFLCYSFVRSSVLAGHW